MTKEVVEVIYGKRHKYEIYRVSKAFGSYEFIIYRDGEYHRGVFDSLAIAVQRAREEG